MNRIPAIVLRSDDGSMRLVPMADEAEATRAAPPDTSLLSGPVYPPARPNGGHTMLLALVTVLLAVVSAGVAYLYAKWEDYKATQAVSLGPVENALSMPVEIDMSLKERKTFSMETAGEYGELVPLEEGLEAVRTGPKSWLLIPTQTGSFRLLGYTALRNRPTPYQVTVVKVKEATAKRDKP